MSERLKCPSCGIPTIEGRPDTTEDDLYCNQCEETMTTQGGAQFTPGPWVVNANGDIASAQGDICWLPINESKRGNANLIAAAPAMYEALKVALEDINSTIETDVLANLVASPDDHGLAATHRIIWQAIAQAEGRSDHL